MWRELGHRNGAGVLELIKRLEARAARSEEAQRRLAEYRALGIES